MKYGMCKHLMCTPLKLLSLHRACYPTWFIECGYAGEGNELRDAYPWTTHRLGEVRLGCQGAGGGEKINKRDPYGRYAEDLLIHGDSVYDIIDKQDHQAIQTELVRNSTSPSDDDRMFLCRMNVSRNARRQMRFGDQKVSGHFGFGKEEEQASGSKSRSKIFNQNTHYLIL
ncbi:hypothetical protein RUM43_010396 [Polyplax serrata]|uniref:Uncharacterized protein n=1 Tax=Polyplax serrata TaxID=468196 RepID=A0AAN8S812_POLSC